MDVKELTKCKMNFVSEDIPNDKGLQDLKNWCNQFLKNKLITLDENSFLYWCSKNNIPVYSPGITDSAIGLQTYFFKQKNKDFGIDVTADMNELASTVLNADKTGGIILGGGISKHHAIGVNILRGGFDYAVYVTTAAEWDGSLSGAKTKEAISWGKIKENANHITVNSDATIVLPLLYSKLKV